MIQRALVITVIVSGLVALSSCGGVFYLIDSGVSGTSPVDNPTHWTIGLGISCFVSTLIALGFGVALMFDRRS